MAPRRISVFFYGLFMDAEILWARGVEPSNPRRASVPGFALRIGKRATLVPAAGSRVHGIIMELSHEEVERLYAEPSVQMYRAEAVLAELDDGSPVASLCFNLIAPPSSAEHNDEYAQRLRELARRLALPSEYVDSIR